MWHLGKRLKWFSIDRTRPIMHQLKAIEEQVISDLSKEANGAPIESEYYCFRSPVKFYEKLA